MPEQLPPAPNGTKLRNWANAGHRADQSDTVTFTNPDQVHVLTVDVDGPVDGYLLRKWTLNDGRE